MKKPSKPCAPDDKPEKLNPNKLTQDQIDALIHHLVLSMRHQVSMEELAEHYGIDIHILKQIQVLHEVISMQLERAVTPEQPGIHHWLRSQING